MAVYEFHATTMDGERVELSNYRGKVLLIVNTASKCGYSVQFSDLQKLYERYLGQGFEILGFPCNQFNEKEPGSNPEVREYCETNFGITFSLFQKVDVRGNSAHPLFTYLTQQAPFQNFNVQTSNGQWMQDFLQTNYPDIYADDGIKWNFTKFLIDRNGHVHHRYETTIEPLDLRPDIETLLSK